MISRCAICGNEFNLTYRAHQFEERSYLFLVGTRYFKTCFLEHKYKDREDCCTVGMRMVHRKRQDSKNPTQYQSSSIAIGPYIHYDIASKLS